MVFLSLIVNRFSCYYKKFLPKRMIKKYLNAADFVEKHLKLVEMERQAEIDQQKEMVASLSPDQLERAGICMRRMVLASQAVSLFGRTVCTFQPSAAKRSQMAQTSGFSSVLSPGDIAGLCQAPNFGKTILSGVVTRVQEGKIDIAFDSLESAKDDTEFDSDEPVDIIRLAPDITYRRLKTGLENLHALEHPLVEVFFQQRPPALPQNFTGEVNENEPEDKEKIGLNSSQTCAISNALAQPEVAVIHGPPGTGKTTTLAEFLSRAVARGVKVLACAPSNVAVDNLAEKLIERGVKNVIRLGHPARVLPRLQSCCLDAVISSSDIMAVCDDIKQEISDHSAKLLRSRDRSERWRLRGILRELRKDLSTRHRRAVKEVIQGADVVLSTLTSLGNEDGVLARNSKQMQFGLVAIDECSQALEAACWLALPLAPKCVLAGDHLQLPPTIVSEKAASEGLAISLMERAVSFLPPSTVTLLSVQYRMNVDIMDWSNKYLYDSKLSAHSSVAKHTLADLLNKGDGKTPSLSVPVIFVDTAGCPECVEMPAPDDLSHGNPGEAVIVGKHVAQLINDCGLAPALVGVISPYNYQVELIREQLSQLLTPVQSNAIEVRSVDGFQGREKEAIILSLVRSNEEGVIGFLGEVRRLNVAITRARRQLFVIGDSETLKRGGHLANFVTYLYERAEIRSGSEYFDTKNKVPEVVKAEKIVKTPEKEKESVTVSVLVKENEKNEPKIEPEKGEKIEVVEEDEEQEIGQPKKSNRALKKERKQRQLEEKLAKIGGNEPISRPKTTSSDVGFGVSSPDPNEMVVKPVQRAPILMAGVAKARGIEAADLATRAALDSVGDPNDVDALCEAVRQLDTICAYHHGPGERDPCNKSVNLLAEFCRYCRRKFCLAHAQPEIHGCGTEAKVFERQAMRSAFETRQRRENCQIPERVAKHSLDRSVLERRMEERLSKMKDERNNKNKKKK